MRQLRQGDLLIERLEHLPDDHEAGEPVGAGTATVIVLAEGEASGHAHHLVAPNDRRFARAAGPGDPLAIGVLVLDGPA